MNEGDGGNGENLTRGNGGNGDLKQFVPRSPVPPCDLSPVSPATPATYFVEVEAALPPPLIVIFSTVHVEQSPL